MADGRFAPSPTGDLHLGSLRTALAAWLFSRANSGRFLIRMEDLDEGRVREHHYTGQLEDLRALGLDWDGDPVRQSERIGLYDAALQQLADAGLVYECWCTRAEIRVAPSAPHGDLPEGAYPGTCRDLSNGERTARRASARPPALRLRAGEAAVGFEDMLRGPVSGRVDDFILRRGDGVIAYQLAVVVDDAEQKIDLVVRGTDLLDSTPRQILLARLLGHERSTSFAHVPLVLGPDGTRLAKRHGAVTLADRAERPEIVLSMLAASLGLADPGEPVTTDQLLERFDPNRLPAEPWVLQA
ncbi:MAG: tRNA glutamyl-Q(34) synthetase GluQRS [Thermoleophilaceae bacterium]|nr:tRNA glutamyl-Q(34) synthetase GluQRS [Thermoleophilaceae bacterium]